ncbi:hypothetical protein PMI15_00943 [Polaromonas sp. CF318]|nr:hypothetical protein [Polaromonas sp. CF318]EJL87575.1 hypothetical protein PMI15_00943 [Polaromonas sp. CF318]
MNEIIVRDFEAVRGNYAAALTHFLRRHGSELSQRVDGIAATASQRP